MLNVVLAPPSVLPFFEPIISSSRLLDVANHIFSQVTISRLLRLTELVLQVYTCLLRRSAPGHSWRCPAAT